MNVIASLYCDGGVIERNPSPFGGTWAWCMVGEDGSRIGHGSGICVREDNAPAITNNLTELIAAVVGMELLPEGWAGRIYTDSIVTLYRIERREPGRPKAKMAGIPLWLVDRLEVARAKLGAYEVHLLGGHPSRAELATGRKAKSGLPCSIHNVLCDKLCAEESARFMKGNP